MSIMIKLNLILFFYRNVNLSNFNLSGIDLYTGSGSAICQSKSIINIHGDAIDQNQNIICNNSNQEFIIENPEFSTQKNLKIGQDELCNEKKQSIICFSIITGVVTFQKEQNSIINQVVGAHFKCIHQMDDLAKDQIVCFMENNSTQDKLFHLSPQSLRYKIKMMEAGYQNLCLILRDINTMLVSIECIDLSKSNIISSLTLIPSHLKEIQTSELTNFMSKIKSFSIGSSIACITFATNLRHLSTCWGSCNGFPCTFPVYLKTLADKVVTGASHACSLLKAQEVLNIPQYSLSCWGENLHGQTSIPDGWKNDVQNAQLADGITCIVLINRSMACWGRHIYTFNSLNKIFRVVSAGGRHTCGARDGKQFCFGSDEYGQSRLINNIDDINQAGKALVRQKIPEISAGWDFTCQLNGFIQLPARFLQNIEIVSNVSCAGFNVLGQTEVPVVLNETFIESALIRSGLSHTCMLGLTNNKNIDSNSNNSSIDPENPNSSSDESINMFQQSQIQVCWGGYNEHGELNISQDINQNELTVGDHLTCGSYPVTFDSSETSHRRQMINCWGNNEYGQLKINDEHLIFTEVQSLSGGGAHVCIAAAVEESPQVQKTRPICWGNDLSGQVEVPVDIRTVAKVVAAGDSYTCAISHFYHTMVCWGKYQFDVLGEDKLIKGIEVNQDQFCTMDLHDEVQCHGGNDYGKCNVPTQGLV